jgi:hypothetical protein
MPGAVKSPIRFLSRALAWPPRAVVGNGGAPRSQCDSRPMCRFPFLAARTPGNLGAVNAGQRGAEHLAQVLRRGWLRAVQSVPRRGGGEGKRPGLPMTRPSRDVPEGLR